MPPGLDRGMCLVVDKVAMDSMASDEPWVFALEASFDHRSQVPDGEYPGYFRVAIDSIMPGLYPMLAAMAPEEPWPSDSSFMTRLSSAGFQMSISLT